MLKNLVIELILQIAKFFLLNLLLNKKNNKKNKYITLIEPLIK